MGGKIWLNSAPDKGSEFSFSIPYRPVDSVILANIEPLKEKTAIVVSKSKSRFEKLSKITKHLGIQLRYIKSGVETVEFFQGGLLADMVLIDIDLDQMNGITTTKAIRAFNKNLTVIAIKNKENSKFEVEDAIAVGCSDYIRSEDSDSEILNTILFNIIDRSNLKF